MRDLKSLCARRPLFRAARALSADRIAAWADKQASLTRELCRGEREAPGHIVRWEIARKQARSGAAA